MSSQLTSFRISDSIARLKLVMLNPRTCWDTIANDRARVASLLKNIVAPIAILAALGPVIGHSFIGFNVENFGTWKAPLFYSLMTHTLEVVLLVTSLFIDAWMLHKLAPQFYRSVSFDRAFSLSANAAIPGFLGWALGIIPTLMAFRVVAFAYGFYALFFGFDKMIAVNANAPKNDTKPAFFACSVALMVVIHVITQGLVEPIAPSPFFDILR